MGKPIAKVDTKELEKFSRELEKLADNEVGPFLEDCARQLAARVLRRTVQKTPRDTSELARGWRAGGESKASAWADSAQVTKTGNTYEILISNPVEYSVYVEYGHRTRGPHIPENEHKTKETNGWVPGFFMLTLSIEEVDRMKNGLLEKFLSDFLKKKFS